MKPFFILLLCSLLVACKKDKEATGCEEKEPFAVSIIIDEFPEDSLTVDTDSILINTFITLRADYPTNGYTPLLEWQVTGMPEKIYTKEITTRFQSSQFKPGDEIDITLSVRVPPDACNSQLQGNDTLRQVVSRKATITAWKDAAIIGRYKGLFAADMSQKDTQIVEIRYFPPDNIFTDGQFGVFNVQKGCNQVRSNPLDPYWFNLNSYSHTGNRSMLLTASNVFYNGCLGPSAWLRLSANNRDSLIVDYSFAPDINQWQVRSYDQFRGKKI